MSQHIECEGAIPCERQWGSQPSYAVVPPWNEAGLSMPGYSSRFLGYLSLWLAAWMVLREALCGYMTEA